MTASSARQLQRKLSRLQQQNQKYLFLALWRSLIVTSLAGGLLWMISLPYWQIAHKSQIQIEGDRLVSENTIHSLINFSYPQFIWTIHSQKLVQKLESTPAILAARVTKQIMPPRLTISLQERNPVALALSQGKVGFLDEKGNWIEEQFYGEINSGFPLPKLKVVNFQPYHRNSWVEIYRFLQIYSTVKVDEVIWDRANNLFLKTEIGTVYFGSNLSHLEKKFKVLVRLKNLPTYLERSKIAYIDLSDPDFNLIQKYQE